ncbi:MAG: hypothetical protein JSV23_00940 [Promethearchaeota archaeon]|nr:MAG: hypothetical protein JSV23_00940 [Candidatus Lokiarchaeota archaeon]
MREMGKNTKKKFAYCKNCEKKIFKPKRKPMESMYYNVWILAIVSSLGFAIVPFLIYRYVILKKKICPFCQNHIYFYGSPEEIPEPKAQIARILQTIEQEKKETDEFEIYCPYCQQEINKQEDTCPNCGASLKE